MLSREPMVASSAAKGVAGMARRPGGAPRGPAADHSILAAGDPVVCSECPLLFRHRKERGTIGRSRAGGLMKCSIGLKAVSSCSSHRLDQEDSGFAIRERFGVQFWQ